MALTLTTSQGSIKADWDAISGAAGYRITNGVTTVELNASTLTYTFSGLSDGTQYTVVLSALAYSPIDIASATTPAAPVTPPTTNPTGVKIGTATRTLNGTNVGRGANELIRYTRTASQTVTPTNQYGVEVTVNESTNKVTAVNNRLSTGSTSGTTIPSGSYVLSGHGIGSGYAGTWLLDNAKVGNTVELTGGTTTTPPPTNPPVSNRSVPLIGKSGLPFNLLYFGPNQAAATSWLNRPMDGAMSFAWVYGWADANNMLGYDKTAAYGPSWNGGVKVVTMSTILNSDANLSTAASGGNNQRYRDFANRLVSEGYTQHPTVVRINHEYNGDWYKWRLNNPNAAAFRDSIKHFVNEVKNIAPNVLFNLCANRQATHSGLWTDGYPGDDFIDIIGIDTYDLWPGVSTQSAFNSEHVAVGGTPHMQDTVNFAAAHGKQWAIDEWGLCHSSDAGSQPKGDNPNYIQFMYDFIMANKSNLAYVTWYNDPGAPSTLHHEVYPANWNPNGALKFKQLFGN